MICVCGKAKMDGVRCRFGATHETLEVSKRKYREMNPHVGKKIERVRLTRVRLSDDLPLFKRRERL